MIEFGSLILYLSIFTISLILINLSNQKKNGGIVFLIIALSLPILLATFRYGVGTDYFNYIRSFNQAGNISIKEYIEFNYMFELGHFLIRKISFIFDSYNFMLALYSIISVVFVYLAIANHQYKISMGISMFLYLCIYYPFSLNIMPQFAAISIVVYSYRFIFEKNIKMFFLLTLIASMFHTTALVAIPIYFLWDKKRGGLTGKWKIAFSLLTCLFVAINYQSIIESITQIEVFSHYAGYAVENLQGQNRDLILKIVTVILLLLLAKPLIKYDERNKLYILLMIFSLIIGFTGFTSPWVKRISLYFEIVQIFLLPSVIYLFKAREEKKIVYLCVCLYGIAYFTLVYYILDQANVIPYNFSL